MKSPPGSGRDQALQALIGCFLCLASATQSLAAGPAPTPGLETVGQSRRQELLVPSTDPNVKMRTSILLPAGGGPYPLAVINHGTTESEELRAQYAEPDFEVVSSWLLARHYAVALPQRPGHGETGGAYIESAGGCEDARYEEAGYGTADSIEAASRYFLRQPYVKKERVLLVGHSAGAWGALALASRNAGLVKGVINFSGGRGGHSYGIANRNCAPDRLVRAAAAYGRATRVPSLWLYSANDTYFGPDLSRRMADAFRAAGGPATYRLLPPVETEGHYLIYSSDAARTWSGIVDKFLTTLH
jgi:pimeloyl-ACP methyl ester carboxylesterase